MLDIYSKIKDAIDTNQTAWVVTVVKIFGSTPSHVGAKMLVYENEISEGTIGGGNLEQLVKKRIKKEHPETLQIWDIDLDSDAKMACGGRVSLIVEPLLSKNKLFIIGGGHCAVQLSELAAKGGFRVTVIDNREEWASNEKHPFAKTVVAPYDEVTHRIDFSENTYIVIMTHQHRFDLQIAEQIINKKYRYLGMIGSTNKVNKTAERLRALKVQEERIKSIHAPIGIEIHSDTPFEIAISIMAELISIKNA